MQREITSRVPLLNEKGQLCNPGWAKYPIWEYNRETIPAELRDTRLREWDYFLVSNEHYGFSISMSNRCGKGFMTVMVMDYDGQSDINKTSVTDNPPEMPRYAEGDIHVRTHEASADLCRLPGRNTLDVRFAKYDGENDLEVHFDLQVPECDSMLIATPWPKDEGEECFYYNGKTNCMPAQGYVKLGEKHLKFSYETDMAVLDFGRGIWTNENVWYWGSASGKVDGVPFGWNIGYGFGDLSYATENMLFYNGVCHKLGVIDSFGIPSDENGNAVCTVGHDWHIFTKDENGNPDGRYDVIFTPKYDRYSYGPKDANGTPVKPCSEQDQVFGYFNGKAVLDDGKVIELKNFWGFAEFVRNHW